VEGLPYCWKEVGNRDNGATTRFRVGVELQVPLAEPKVVPMARWLGGRRVISGSLIFPLRSQIEMLIHT
jgi:hypothetical protein